MNAEERPKRQPRPPDESWTLPRGGERLIALLGGVLAGGLCLVVGLITLVAVGLYDWEVCSTTYDVWNALIGAAGLGSAVGFGGASLVCIGHAVTLGERHIIKPVVGVAATLLVIGIGLYLLNPTPATGEPDSVSKQDCYGDLG